MSSPGTYININDFQTVSSPMPFQHFLGDYALTTTAITTSASGQTAEQCDAICKETPNCEVWKRDSNGVCRTFMAAGTRQSGIKINRATRFIAGSSTVYSLTVPSTTASGNGPTGSSTLPRGSTANDCEIRCNDIAGCGAYSFDTSPTPTCSIFPIGGATSGNVGVLRDMFSDSSTYITLNTLATPTTQSRTTMTVAGSTSLASSTIIEVLIDGGVKATITASQLSAAGTSISFSNPAIGLGPHTIQLRSSSVISNIRTFEVLPTTNTATTDSNQTSASVLTTVRRTFVRVSLAYANSLQTDRFNVSVRSGTYTKSLFTNISLQLLTTTSGTTGIDIGSECTGGKYTLEYTMTFPIVQITPISSPEFTILFRLNAIPGTARGIYSTKVMVAPSTSKLFKVVDSFDANKEKDVFSNPFGEYVFFGTTATLSLSRLQNLKVVTWYSQSADASHLTAATGAEPILALNTGEKFYYIDFGTGDKRFTLPFSVLVQGSGQTLNIHTNIKRFSPGRKTNTILFGSGASNVLRGGVWIGLENSTRKYIAHRGGPSASSATPASATPASAIVHRAIANSATLSSSPVPGIGRINWSLPFTATQTPSVNIRMNNTIDVSVETNFNGSSAYIAANATAANNGLVGGSSYVNNTNFDNFNGGLDAIYVHTHTMAFTTAEYNAINLHST